MIFRSIRWRIAVPYVLLLALVIGAMSLYLSGVVRQGDIDQLNEQLTAEARLVADSAAPLLDDPLQSQALDALAVRTATLLNVYVTIVAADGALLAQSHESVVVEDIIARPEIQQALAEGQGSATRPHDTNGEPMMFVALLIIRNDRLLGVVRLAVPLAEVERRTLNVFQSMLVAAFVAGGLAVILAMLIDTRIAIPVRRLTVAANHMAEGDFSARIVRTTRDEIGQLTIAFNHMADQFKNKVATLGEERHRLATILDHLADGIIITDAAGFVLRINAAACRLLATTEAKALNHSFAEVVRHYQLIDLWQRSRDQNDEQVDVVEVDRKRLFLQAIITPFPGTESQEFQEYMVILQDLTQIRRLETIRRDFISNISHELRTPLASLRALVETLRDGALDDPPAARRFLERAEVEVDALTQIVQELLDLSRIEAGQLPLRLAPTPVEAVVLPIVKRMMPQAERADLTLTVELSADLPPVLVDGERVQQVVTNLVHNAIKFTLPGGCVTVTAYQVDDVNQPATGRFGQLEAQAQVVVQVTDTGVGIPDEDLPRIFERFYKADRARSGGGTGLGLAIAKHIIQVHGGEIWAKSKEGKGSSFYFSLLQAQPE